MQFGFIHVNHSINATAGEGGGLGVTVGDVIVVGVHSDIL